MAEANRVLIPPKRLPADFTVIDTDPHVLRCFRYARPEDYAYATGYAALGPGLFYGMERVSPSHIPKSGYAPLFRLSCAIGAVFGVMYVWQKSSMRFYGWMENSREVDMDMREMVDKVKKGQPLYGETSMSPYMQGVAARNSRYSAAFGHLIPWGNFFNHNQHGVDTAKYYQQAERELEAERQGKAGS